MIRSPEFIVKYNNRADSEPPAYAYQRGSQRWIRTRIVERAHIFNRYADANAVRDSIALNHANNSFVDVIVERIDLCDSILEDIDILSVM